MSEIITSFFVANSAAFGIGLLLFIIVLAIAMDIKRRNPDIIAAIINEKKKELPYDDMSNKHRSQNLPVL